MKNIFNKFAFFIALSFVFISCGNLTTSENDDSIPQGKGKITISTDLQNGRSVLPTAIDKNTEGLTWELEGTCEGKTYSKIWNDTTSEDGVVTTAYNKMKSANDLLLDVGTWNFTLKVKNNSGYVLFATKEVSIETGENKLSFEMKEATSSDIANGETVANGSIEFTLKFPKDVVDNVEAKLFKYENNDTEISKQTLSIDSSSTDNYSSVKYSYPDATGTTSTDLSAGYYILKIELQQKKVDTTTPAAEPKTINTYSCLIRVAPGLLSKREYTLPDLAQLYTISYLDVITNDDGTTSTENATFDSTETITVTYNEYTSFELPTPIKDGYTFLGWYTDETYDTPASNDGTYKISTDTNLYAKWVEVVSGVTHANNTLYISSYEGLKVFRDIVNGSLPMAITIPANESISGAKPLDWNAMSSGSWLSVELEKDICVTDAWIPIGRPDATRSHGATFDGNNHTITLSNGIASDGYVALFSRVTGTIKNLVVEGRINSQGSNAVAGICASSYGGTFEHCVNKCIINSNTSSGTGGIVGYSDSKGATIKSCVNMGEISSSLSTIGGIVGTANTSSSITIENSINLGKITGTSNVSGIFGLGSASTQKITDCINIGEIKATGESGYAAGIITPSSDISVLNCINAGIVDASQSGAITSSSSGTYSNCYYDSSKINSPNDSNVAGIDSKTTSDLCSPDSSILSNWLKDASRYPLPNIVATDNLEGISESVWSGICELAKVDTSSSGSSGTATGITYAGTDSTSGLPKFLISSPEGLSIFRNMVNGLVLSDIIIPSDESSASDYTVTSGTDCAAIYGELKNDIQLTNENWIPIGSSDRPFTGSFNGNKNTISNLNINNATTDNQGLFGVVEGSSSRICNISNLNVEGTIISSNCNVGGIAGKATYTKFDSCVNKASVESTSSVTNVCVAGIVGYISNVEIANCYNSGYITANGAVAGIVGFESESTISNSTFKSCINIGTITGGSYYSGIIGYASTALALDYCANYGTIVSKTNDVTGCIIGGCSSSSKPYVSECLSVGPIITEGTYFAICEYASMTCSIYDSTVLSGATENSSGGDTGMPTTDLISENYSEIENNYFFSETYTYQAGCYPIPDISDCVSEAIWQEIIVAATPQNSGSSGIETNANVSQFSELKAQIESVSDTAYTLENPYVIGITSSFDIGTDITATTNVKSHIKLVATNPDGCTITKNDSLAAANIFTVEAGASLTLGDSNAVGELIIDGNETLTTTTKSLISVTGTLVLNEKSTLQNNKCKEGWATNGAAVYSNNGTVKILGGTVKNNSNSYNDNTGGAIYIKNGTFEMTAGVVSNNSSYSSGGAIYVESSTVTISGGTFDTNKASSIDNNKVYGGALFLSNCTVNITGGTFSNNIATNTGTTTTNTEFYGGAIYIINSGTSDAPALISNCTFSSNSAYQNGGAIYTGGTSYINIDSSTFKYNTVTNGDAQGSAVYIGNMDGNIIINNCEFSTTTSDTIFTVYNGSSDVTHQVNGNDLSPKSGYNPN